MNESTRPRATVDRAARRNYVLFCAAATVFLGAVFAAAVVLISG
jgi:hypothetical protein